MTQSPPHYSLFKIINVLSLVGKIIFWGILILSIIPHFFKKSLEEFQWTNFINLMNIILIIVFFVIEIIKDLILIPMADNQRKDDFIDNSFGSRFSTNNSVGYYDNDELPRGLYKAAVNLFENCYFTFSLIKAYTLRKLIEPSIVLLVTLIFAYNGFKETPFALSILQALLSTTILGSLVKHFILFNRLSVILDSWITLFQNEDLKNNPHKSQASIYRYWLQYETLINRIPPNIPNKLFYKLNTKLTGDWNDLKKKYKI